ncbi:hypothetical protein PR202_gb23844 [Eleusine coracana subsp. coracana]|uniref:Uncharacterized protein n=1 Tax=Eleusine coracana subsp. coracana TaxID=191504 RepID=A0AAV5FK08_ELECO|nr:hypothetical protein PR202_gb23844 [Eleusine coracana subsp. coracana]
MAGLTGARPELAGEGKGGGGRRLSKNGWRGTGILLEQSVGRGLIGNLPAMRSDSRGGFGGGARRAPRERGVGDGSSSFTVGRR